MKTRFGVVGTGYWAEQVHLPVMRDHPDVELVGIWGRSTKNAQALADRIGTSCFANFTQMLDAVDAVDFVVPPDVQAPLAVAAARAGKHLVLEKPLALALADAEALADAIVANGVASVVFFTRRFTDDVERSIAELAPGGWTAVRGHLYAGAMRPGTPYSESGWRQVHGALFDIGPHVLSLLLPILGPVVAVVATRMENQVIRLEFEHGSGARSDVSLSLHAEPSQFGESYRFTGPNGSTDLAIAPAPRLEALGRAVSQLISSIPSGAQSQHCDAAYALGISRILAAAENSAGTGNGTRVAVSGG